MEFRVAATPLLGCGVLLATFITTYLTATLRGDVPAWLPSLSSTGGYPPESCIFTAGLTFATLFLWTGGLAVYLRRSAALARTPEHALSFVAHRRVSRINLAAFVLLTIALVAMLLVAAFQDTTVAAVHYPAAFILFGLSAVYQVLMVVCERMVPLASVSPRMLRFKIVVACASLVVLLGGFLTAVLHWFRLDPAFVSPLFEYILAASLMVFWCTCYFDLRGMRLRVIAVEPAVDESRALLAHKAGSSSINVGMDHPTAGAGSGAFGAPHRSTATWGAVEAE